MRVFISTGEASGDVYAAELVKEIRQVSRANLHFEGIGGKRMGQAGIALVADTSTWGAISIAQSLAMVPKAIGGYYRAKRALDRDPGLFIPIDFGYANIRLARHAKNRGWKVLYFVPPGSWRRDRQGKDLVLLTDAISTPFSWSAEILNRNGGHAHWFGHPIKQLLALHTPTVESVDAISPHLEGPRVAVLPGSRKHEIEENLPVIAEAIRSIDSDGNAYRPLAATLEFALAPSADENEIRSAWSRLAPERQHDRFITGDTYGVLRRGRAAIVCSGTATLEAALCGCPMVVIYRATKAMAIEAKIIGFRRPRFIALPNILLDRPVVPELVQLEATPVAIRAYLESLLKDGPERTAQLEAFAELTTALGPSDAITQTAKLAVSLTESP